MGERAIFGGLWLGAMWLLCYFVAPEPLDALAETIRFVLLGGRLGKMSWRARVAWRLRCK